MTCDTYDVTAGRQWCIETAIEACGGDNPVMPRVAAQLIALLETGRPIPDGEPADRPLEFHSMRVGEPVTVPTVWETPPDNGTADPNAGALSVQADTVTADPEPPTAAEQDPPPPTRSVPRMPPPAASPAPSDLSEKDQAVLAAVTLFSVGETGWPTHAQIAETSGVPRGSLGYVLERLRDKGHLQRIDGKWALAEADSERGAVA